MMSDRFEGDVRQIRRDLQDSLEKISFNFDELEEEAGNYEAGRLLDEARDHKDELERAYNDYRELERDMDRLEDRLRDINYDAERIASRISSYRI